MMGNRIAKETLRLKWLLIGVVIYFYSFTLKNEIFGFAKQNGLNVNVWDAIYTLQNDMYLTVFFLLPIMLFTSIKIISSDFNYALLIRVESFSSWLIYTTKEFLIKISPLFLLMLILSVLMSLGLPFELKWSSYSLLDTGINELNILHKSFSSPVMPLLLQLLLWILVSIAIHGFLIVLFLAHEKLMYLYLQSVLFFLLCIIGFKVFPEQIKFLSPTAYFTVAAALDAASNLILIMLVPLIIYLLEIAFVKYKKRNKLISKLMTKELLPYLIYIGLTILYIVSSYYNHKEEILTLGDLIAAVFLGVNAFSFSFTSLFAYLIIFFGLIYLSQIRLQQELSEISHYKIIRYGSIDKWFLKVFSKEVLFLLIALFLLLTFIFLFGTGVGLEWSFKTDITSLQNIKLVAFIIGISLLQLVCYLLFSMITIWKSSEGYFLLMLFGILSIMLLPGMNKWGVFPVGLNSLVITDLFSVRHVLIVLAIYIAASIIFLKTMFSKSLKI